MPAGGSREASLIGSPIPQTFYLEDTVRAARGLLGKILLRRLDHCLLSGRIVETEAYLAQGDPACHASRGPTPRNRPMFGPPGRAYVYFIYGNHYCFNVVTAPEGVGEAVLVRALQPLTGLEEMAVRRGVDDLRLLCSGPGRLCRALAIDGGCNGADLSCGDLLLLDDGFVFEDIEAVPRVGIRQAADLPLRFYPRGHRFVSR